MALAVIQALGEYAGLAARGAGGEAVGSVSRWVAEATPTDWALLGGGILLGLVLVVKVLDAL